jgi:hypothetical protein
MMIHDAIRKANSEHTVYFLLTAYLDTLQFSRQLPEHLTVLPIADLRDLESRFEKLVTEFETELRMPDSHKFFVLLEAVGIFDLAAVRVCQLINERADPRVAAMRSLDIREVREASASW